ncbi:MAG: hypothetical protein CMI02_17490 [Oceanospirillaceae bacterium]|nr:hypothetical protein [Oceanospirillaceae bacterium]MBT13817.1 hypothetical protein [Oceanospirillaceae bacterium]
MKEFTTPDFLKDAATLLSADGFATSNVWYHGTASGLVDAIKAEGLKGSGDTELMERQMKTLGTIGHDTSDHKDPLFVTQSRELAYFWANQKAHTRSMYLQQQETPVVLQLELPDELNKQVITDAGAAALVLEPGNLYLLWLKELYKEYGHTMPELDPFKCDRMDFMNKLGLAYCAADIAPQYLTLLQAQ